MVGIMGRALYPELPADVAHHGSNDVIFPLLVREMTGTGLMGLVVAGILAAALSTYDSIGSALSSLLVRDVYARLFVSNRDDQHYLRVGQWLTPVIIFGSFRANLKFEKSIVPAKRVEIIFGLQFLASR